MGGVFYPQAEPVEVFGRVLAGGAPGDGISAAHFDRPGATGAFTALAPAAAETVIHLGDPIIVTGPGVVVSGTTATITDAGVYRASGTLADGMLDVNTTEDVELILDGAVITHTSGPVVNVTNAASLALVLADGASYSDMGNEGSIVQQRYPGHLRQRCFEHHR